VKAATVLVLLSIAVGPMAMAQSNEVLQLFDPAVAQIQGKTKVPVLLPSKLPAVLLEQDLKVWGEGKEDGYSISLWENGPGGRFIAGFTASKRPISDLSDLPNLRRVVLASGSAGLFRPVSCGGSCAPANLWWEQNGVLYHIQIKLPSGSPDEEERILLEAANSSVQR
jgi:hypothetical protein